MCVTNTTNRRAIPVSLSGAATAATSTAFPRVSGHPQDLSERLIAAPAFTKPTVTKKRRRKPQQPGLTAKHNQRHFVVHKYCDHSQDVEDASALCPRKGGVSVAFPVKLQDVLEQVRTDGLGHVISWQPHGRCFVIHQPKVFVEEVMPKYFRQTKLTSFQRQLNLYGFCRLTRGPDAGGYYHELFLRHKVFLCHQMTRTKVKGTKFKAASSPDQEPDFYSMPFVNGTTVAISSGSEHEDEEESYSDHHSDTSSLEPFPVLGLPTSSTSNLDPASFYENAVVPNSSISYSFAVPQQQKLVYFPPPTGAAKAPDPTVSEGDQILDEALDELFFSSPEVDQNLEDFIHEWDPTETIGDGQLGFMLDQLVS